MTDLPDGIDWDTVGWVTSSHYRVDVLDRLENPKTPSAIAGEDLEISHVSRALGELRDEGLVDLLVDEERKKGRIYARTALGEKMVDVVEEYEDDA